MTGARGANALVAGKVLAFSGIVLLVAALVAWAGWLPFSVPASRALAMLFAVTGAVDLSIASFFMLRYRP